MTKLKILSTAKFLSAVSAISNAGGLYDFLTASPEVQAIKRALADTSLSIDDVEKFVSTCLRRFKPGRRFSGDYTIAAITVALTYVPGQAVEGLLRELGSLTIAEMPLAPRVAVAALAHRAQSVAALTAKSLTISIPNRESKIVVPIFSGNGTTYLLNSFESRHRIVKGGLRISGNNPKHVVDDSRFARFSYAAA